MLPLFYRARVIRKKAAAAAAALPRRVGWIACRRNDSSHQHIVTLKSGLPSGAPCCRSGGGLKAHGVTVIVA